MVIYFSDVIEPCFEQKVSLHELYFFFQEIYDRGFASMERSHQRVIKDMRAAHKRELEKLRTEKDQLLHEETKATQAGM